MVRSSINRPIGRLAASASLLTQDGEAEAALPALRFAAKEEPTVAAHQLHLGEALALTGDGASARAAYRKAAELLPGDESPGDNRRAYRYLIEKGLRIWDHRNHRLRTDRPEGTRELGIGARFFKTVCSLLV